MPGWRGRQGRRDGGSRLLQTSSQPLHILVGREEAGEGGAEWKCEPREARGVGGWMRGPCPRPPTRACSPGADNVLLAPRSQLGS